MHSLWPIAPQPRPNWRRNTESVMQHPVCVTENHYLSRKPYCCMGDEKSIFPWTGTWAGFSFNYRVLMEAADKSVPLYSRISFLSIFLPTWMNFFRCGCRPSLLSPVLMPRKLLCGMNTQRNWCSRYKRWCYNTRKNSDGYWLSRFCLSWSKIIFACIMVTRYGLNIQKQSGEYFSFQSIVFPAAAGIAERKSAERISGKQCAVFYRGCGIARIRR